MSFIPGDAHEVMVELEGIGGGGKVYLEVWYPSSQSLLNSWKDFFLIKLYDIKNGEL